MADLYQTLGVSKGASAAEIKKAYHKMARTCHPDVTKNDPKSAEKFKEISAAYDKLAYLMAEGKLAQAVEKIYPLAEVKDAVARAQEEFRGGKIVISMAEL